MRIVIALGGNALLRRGEAMTMPAQQANAWIAAVALAAIQPGNALLVTHGNGPHVGLLALQALSHEPTRPISLDMLGAESEGMIGYMIEQELRNTLPPNTGIATLLTMVEVDPASTAFSEPTKFIGPGYDRTIADRLTAAHDWRFRQDGAHWRRVVPSPLPLRVLQTGSIRCLLENGAIVIAAGGGGIPVIRDAAGALRGAEAVIDKDHCSALLALELNADMLLLATDVDAVYADWGAQHARAIRAATPEQLVVQKFPAGSMGPKVEAACDFVRRSGKTAVIGALGDLPAMLRGEAGTVIQQSGA